jgi:hypothetical protein
MSAENQREQEVLAQAGVHRDALIDAIHVGYLFNVFDRLADSMVWHVPDHSLGSYEAGARRLLRRGYQQAAA